MGLNQVDVDIPKSAIADSEPKKKKRKRFDQEFEDDESSSNDGSEEKEDEKDESVSDDEDKLCETENNSYRRLDELDLYLALKID
ncbi:unnamed protein product, partial [Didymodactylos carnosus]